MLILTCAYNVAAKQSAFCSTTSTAVTTASSEVLPGLVLPGAGLASGFKGNPLYPSTLELDFIVCFRVKAVGSNQTAPNPDFTFTNTSLGLLSSTGVIHA